MSPTDDLTIPAVVRVLTRVAPRLTLTPRRVRYLVEALGRLDPAHRPLGQGDAALFSVEDCALLLLAFQIQAIYGHRIAWAVMTYLGEDLRRRLRSADPSTVIEIEAGRARLVTSGDPRVGASRFSIADAARRVRQAVALERRARDREDRRIPRWKAPELVASM